MREQGKSPPLGGMGEQGQLAGSCCCCGDAAAGEPGWCSEHRALHEGEPPATAQDRIGVGGIGDEAGVTLLAAAIMGTRLSHGGNCDLDNPSTPAATVALIRPTASRVDYLVLCDAFIVHDNGTDVEVITDSRFETAISRVRARHLTGAPFGSEEHAEQFRLAGLEKQHLTNSEDGYWIAAATPEAARHAITGTLPHSTRRLALLTDGASRAVDVFGLFGWRELLDLIAEDGPEELIRQVRKAELQDAAGTEQPRFKKHDDATVVVCTFRETP